MKQYANITQISLCYYHAHNYKSFHLTSSEDMLFFLSYFQSGVNHFSMDLGSEVMERDPLLCATVVFATAAQTLTPLGNVGKLKSYLFLL